MAQSWITEVSMEIDAETPKAPAPPVPPPPPPEPAPPPAPPAAAPGYTTAPAAPSGVTSSAPQTAATPFYQDPYRSFSQYGAAQQYADPQVQWAGYYGGYGYNSGTAQQYPGYPTPPAYHGYNGYQDPQQQHQQQYEQQAYAQQWQGYATVPQSQPLAAQAYAVQPPQLHGQPYLPTPEAPPVVYEAQPQASAQAPGTGQAPGTVASLPPPLPPPPPPPPDAGEEKTPAFQDTSTHRPVVTVDSVASHEVRQPEQTGADSYRGNTKAATNGAGANGSSANGASANGASANGATGDRATANGATDRTKAADTREEESEDDGAWPASLRRYLQRAFDKCDKKPGSRQHALLEKALHRKVTDAMADNAMLTKDWDNEPLPSLLPPPKRERSPSRSGRNHQAEKSKKRSHGQMGGRETPAQRKGKGSLSKMPHMDHRRLSNRLERFEGMRPPPSSSRSTSGNTDLAFKSKPMVDDNGMVDWAAITIKGTSTSLEKDYLRLTQPPDPASVRPQPILEKSLEKISAKWAKGGMDYVYACSQLKAVRQDCVVQRIKNAFTVKVYEGHARIALQQGDLNEYNQCQTQLQELYACGLAGSQQEFTAYRVLYYLYLQTSCSGGSTGLTKILQELPAGEQDPAVSHALRVRKALAMTDYHLFFSLYETTPNLGRHIMQKLLKTTRVEALRRIIKSYRPTISLSFVLRELLFDTDEDGVAFLQACGVVFTPNGLEVACKESSVDASGLDADAPNSLL